MKHSRVAIGSERGGEQRVTDEQRTHLFMSASAAAMLRPEHVQLNRSAVELFELAPHGAAPEKKGGPRAGDSTGGSTSPWPVLAAMRRGLFGVAVSVNLRGRILRRRGWNHHPRTLHDSED